MEDYPWSDVDKSGFYSWLKLELVMVSKTPILLFFYLPQSFLT
jgi:hypothetical protein